MKRALAGVFLAALVVLGLPVSADAASDTPIVSAPSTSYSGQPHPYTVTVFNRLDNSKLSATLSNNGSHAMSCKPAGAILGLGTWKCTYSGRLGIGSVRVTATARSGSKSRTGSGSASVTSRFGISSHTSTVNQGGTFTVSGSYDHVSGASDFSVRANGTACATSGSSFTCSLQAPDNIGVTSKSYSVTVTESGSGGSRSASTSVTVLGQGAPGAPSFSSARTIKNAAQPTTITGSTSDGGLRVQLLVDPKGRNWASPAVTCTSSASGAWSCPLSQTLKPGKHTIVARTVDPSDPSRVSPESSFTLTVQKPQKVEPPAPPITASPSPVAPPVGEPPVEEAPEPVSAAPTSGSFNNLLELLVLALAVLTLARPGALTANRAGSSASFTDRNPDEQPAELETVGWGDQSPTWAAFGTDATDYWSRVSPPVVARYSPFLSRLLVDGVGFRAMFGSLWWLLQIGGVVLGVLAAQDTAFQALPPSAGLVVAILAIGCLDACAGFLASVVFTVCVIGDLDRHGFGVVIALGFLWTALPLVATLFRPFRRTGRGGRYLWDRLADLVITALVCGWLAQRIADGMDAIAGTATGLPKDADTIAVVAIAVIAGRVLLGHLVDLGYPERLRATEGFEEFPVPGPYPTVLGFVVRTVLLYLVGNALVGACWQLFAAVILLALPDLLAGMRSRSALAPMLRTGLPAGVSEVLLLVVWGSLLVAFAISRGDGDLEKARFALVAAAALPCVFALAQVMADPDAPRPRTSWAYQLVGLGVVAATTALALHGWNY